MKAKLIGLRVLAMNMAVLAGFSLMQGCTTGDAPVRWLNWPYGTPKDQPVVLPAGPDITQAGILPAGGYEPVVTPVVTPAAAPVAVPSPQTHVVQKGETLSSIASSYGTSWKKLAEYNGLSNPNRLMVGQKINIPGSLDFVAPAKHYSAPASSRPVAGSIKQGSTYTIQKGDVLSRIARRSGLTVNELKMANGLKSDRIIAGKKLFIPKKGEVKAVAVAKPIPSTAANPAPVAAAPATDASFPAPAPMADAAPVATAASAPVYEHVLYPGETLDDVARQYGSSQQEIMKLNHITDPASVKPGTKILVPIPE